MPVLKHAKKKLRQDKKRALKNKHLKDIYKRAIKTARSKPTEKNLSAAFSEIDKAAKHNIIHKNKAGRLKASLTKSVSKPQSAKAETAPAKTAKKPAPAKKSTAKSPKKK